MSLLHRPESSSLLWTKPWHLSTLDRQNQQQQVPGWLDCTFDCRLGLDGTPTLYLPRLFVVEFFWSQDDCGGTELSLCLHSTPRIVLSTTGLDDDLQGGLVSHGLTFLHSLVVHQPYRRDCWDFDTVSCCDCPTEMECTRECITQWNGRWCRHCDCLGQR